MFRPSALPAMYVLDGGPHRALDRGKKAAGGVKPVETKQPSSRISGTLVSLGQLREMSRIVVVRTSSAKLCFFMLRRGDVHHETSFQYYYNASYLSISGSPPQSTWRQSVSTCTNRTTGVALVVFSEGGEKERKGRIKRAHSKSYARAILASQSNATNPLSSSACTSARKAQSTTTPRTKPRIFTVSFCKI